MAKKTVKPRGKDAGGYGNEILYRMCEEQPKHKSINIISSKIWIIGRAYAAAIERGAGKKIKKGEDFCQKQAAPAVRDSEIDKWIKSVSSINRLTSENIVKSLRCHQNVMRLFKRITGGATKRSLASKYLHFHAPHAFFIYDSRANRKVRQHIKRLPPERQLRSHDFDNEYATFCARCLCYRDMLEKRLRKKVTPRMLDMKLLGYTF